MADRDTLLAALEKNWHREMEGAETYRLLAQREKDERRRDILLKLAAAEEGHAERWADRIKALGGAVPDRSTVKPSLGLTLQVASTEVILRKLEAQEERDIAAYRAVSSVLDEESKQILEDAVADEKEHSRILRVMAGPASPRKALDIILKRERWHVGAAGWVGDAIYGVNDGLGAVFGIVSGMAGYTGGTEVVLIAGVTGLVASAVSMGSSAYLASKSEREVYEGELAREKAEIEENPEEEREELELFYQLKGFSAEEARTLVARIQERPDQFLKTLAHEELGLSEATFPNPWKACLSASLSTAVGGLIPILPFFFTTGTPAIVAAALVSVAAHFGVGLAKSLVTVRPWWISGLEMTMVAFIAGAITYGLGLLLSPM